MDSSTGRFVWYELMTTDTKAALAFYTEVVGWKAQEWPDGDPANPYTMFVSGQGPLGGVFPLPEDAKKMGAPPHWMAHVQVEDVDATVAKVKSLGGKVYVEPNDVPKVGRFSVIADPQGGSISVFKPANAMPPRDVSKAGEMTWHELMTSDHAAAFKFYSDVFGWRKVDEMDMGPMGTYLMFGPGENACGGMMTNPKDAQMPTAWLYYIHVDDLDAAIQRSTKMGARVLNGPMDIPGGERVAQLMDPQGAAYALHGPGLAK